MNRIRFDEDIKPMSEFRSGISSFVKQVHDTKRPMVITQHGKGIAVLVDVSEFESMQEKLELLEEVQTASEQIKAGKSITHNQAYNIVMKRLEE